MRLHIAIIGITFGFFLSLPAGKSQSTDSVSVHAINISGNYRTKSAIILKELTIKENAIIALNDSDYIKAACKNNLIKTSLFNFVDIGWIRVNNQQIDLNITLQERWYIIPRIKIKTEEENINAWVENMNFGHISALFSITDENFRGFHEQLAITGSLGFNQSVGIKYLRPSIFGINTLGGGTEIQYTRNKEAIFGLFDYKPRYFLNSSDPLISTFQATMMVYFRPTLAIDELLSVTYAHYLFNDTLQWINHYYYPEKSMDILRVTSKLKFDYRNNKAYPLKGTYYDLILEKAFNLNPSLTRINYAAFTVNARWFGKLGRRSYAALGITASTSSSSEYLFPFGFRIGQSGLEIRSFEQVQIPVTSLAIGRTTFKYQILKRDKQKIHFFENPKFALIHYALYATIFADGAFADYQRALNYEQSMYLKNSWLSAMGCGLDFSTYYDLVIRTEYSYNFAFRKYYFCVHFKAAI